MLRSLYSSIAGLGVNQTKLDVISNNIVNASTTAFKSSRARFEDTLYQNSSSASSPINTLGGKNAAQVGLGVKVAGIDSMMKQGSMQPTNRNTDFAIDGEGYFMVYSGSSVFPNAAGTSTATVSNVTNEVTATGLNIKYTRDGAFSRDDYGNLVTSEGYKVLGYAIKGVDSAGKPVASSVEAQSAIVANGAASAPIIAAASADEKKDGYRVNFVDANNATTAATVDETGANGTANLTSIVIPDEIYDTGTGKYLKVVSFSVDSDGTVKANCGDKTAVIGQIAEASFTNASGLERTGSNMYAASSNSGVAKVRTGTGSAATDNSGSYGDILQNNLEMSNVDLASEFSDMIVATRAFQASGKMITTDDEILQDIVNLKR